MNLVGKVAIVTGAAQGIGRAVAERLARGGVAVALFDVDEAEGRAAADALIAYGERAVFHRCDVTVEEDVAGSVDAVVAAFGPITILVNNAGVNAYSDAETMTQQEWDRVFAVDLKAAWICAKHTLPSMRAAGSGSIVNIASIHAFMTIEGMFPYAAAKSGVVGLTRSLALEYGREGIRVNAVCPGYVRTRLVQEWLDQQPDPVAAERDVLAVHPLGRIGTPEEIASFVAYLCSDDASYITGAALLIDGGLSARFAS